MADDDDEDRPRPKAPRNGVLTGVVTVMVVVMIAGTVLFQSTKTESKAPEVDPGVRTLLVPTDDTARTVVIAPCDAPPNAASRRIAEGDPVPGETTFTLARGTGIRTVVIATCQQGAGAGANLPSAVWIPTGKTGAASGPSPTSIPTPVGDARRAQTRLVMSSGGGARRIVVPPCPESAARREPVRQPDVVLPATPTVSDAVIAPLC